MDKHKQCVIDIETTNLDPTIGRIICIGIRDVASGETRVFSGDDEMKMIDDFLSHYNFKGFKEIIGYNVFFDIRFIFAKCLKYNMPANGFFYSKIIDLMHIMKSVRNGFNYNRPGRLDEWAEAVLGNTKMPLMESIEDLYNKGRIMEIIEYNKWDVEITTQLWERVSVVLWNEE